MTEDQEKRERKTRTESNESKLIHHVSMSKVVFDHRRLYFIRRFNIYTVVLC